MVGQDTHPDDTTIPPLYSPLRSTPSNNCDIYLAPSPPHGWGVFAARDFDAYEIIEVSARFLPIQTQVLQQSVLNDYHYAFHWGDPANIDPTEVHNIEWGVITFGMTMFYNHGEGDQHNVQFLQFGRAPDPASPALSMGLGYAARRKIQRGEELLGTYGGDAWFTGRGLVMETQQPSKQLPSKPELDRREEQFCSKAVSGIGHSTWYRLHLSTHEQTAIQIDPHQFLPLQDHPSAVAKLALREGDVMEYAPALVVPLDHVQNSYLEPLCFLWNDWEEEQQQAIVTLREQGSFRMKGMNPESGEMEWDVLKEWNDAVIFPVGGSIGMLRRVGRDDPTSNCRIEISSSTAEDEEEDYGSAGLVLKLIATKIIQEGEELRLNVPDSSSWFSKTSLVQMLAMTGQPVPRHLTSPYKDVDESLWAGENEQTEEQKDEL